MERHTILASKYRTGGHRRRLDWGPRGTLPHADLIASSCAAVKVTETVKPASISRGPNGSTIVDFGQNLAGKLFIPTLSRPAGHRLRIRHAEVLENGNLGTRPLRSAKQTDTIIFGGQCTLNDWSPRFTYHGFRYVELEGWDADEVTADSLSALVLHTDMRRTGFFECSNAELNQLHRNVIWSMRSNFISLPPTALSATNDSAGPAIFKSSVQRQAISTIVVAC